MSNVSRALLLTVLGASLAACAGHGTYTAAHKKDAAIRMDAMKSATEWQTANQSFLAGDLKKALKHVNNAIALNENVIKSHVLRGRVLMEMGELEEAANTFEHAQAMDPRAVDPVWYMGIINERYCEREKALACFTHASELDPTEPQYVVAAAEVMIDLSHLDDAKDYLTQARARFEHNAGVRQTLGHIALMQQDPKTAAACFDEARLLAPEDPTILEDLARAQLDNGAFAEAEITLARALTIPDNATRRDLIRMRAHCLLKTDRPVEARELLLELTRDRAGAADADNWIALGNISFVLKDMGRVRQAATRAIALAPTRREGYLLRALYERGSGDLAAAEGSLRQANTIEPSADILTLLGVVQQDLNKTDEARASFSAALKMNPKCADASRLLAAVDAPTP